MLSKVFPNKEIQYSFFKSQINQKGCLIEHSEKKIIACFEKTPDLTVRELAKKHRPSRNSYLATFFKLFGNEYMYPLSVSK